SLVDEEHWSGRAKKTRGGRRGDVQPGPDGSRRDGRTVGKNQLFVLCPAGTGNAGGTTRAGSLDARTDRVDIDGPCAARGDGVGRCSFVNGRPGRERNIGAWDGVAGPLVDLHSAIQVSGRQRDEASRGEDR